MFENATNSKKQGDIGMACAISWFVKNGYTVCVPLTDSQNYDLIVDKGRPIRVQVRTSSRKRKSGGYEVTMTVKGGNQSWNKIVKHCAELEDIDAFFFVCKDGNMFLIPREKIKNIRSSIVLGAQKYKEFQV